jgi:hypothetical protein
MAISGSQCMTPIASWSSVPKESSWKTLFSQAGTLLAPPGVGRIMIWSSSRVVSGNKTRQSLTMKEETCFDSNLRTLEDSQRTNSRGRVNVEWCPVHKIPYSGSKSNPNILRHWGIAIRYLYQLETDIDSPRHLPYVQSTRAMTCLWGSSLGADPIGSHGMETQLTVGVLHQPASGSRPTGTDTDDPECHAAFGFSEDVSIIKKGQMLHWKFLLPCMSGEKIRQCFGKL